jgi:signal transduction histidine kinase
VTGPDPRRPLVALLVAAALLALALVAVGLLAATTLRQRDALVRRGTLQNLADELAAELRETGPSGTESTLAAFLERQRDTLRGVELRGPQDSIARAGEVGPRAEELPVALGRDWRMSLGHVGGRPWRERGTPLTVRLEPAAGLGSASSLAAVVAGGSVIAALGLVAASLLAARGLAQRERLAATESERLRLEAVALAGAGLAHRIRNPLAAVKGTAQLLSEQLSGPQRERAERVVAASERIEALIGQVLQFSRPPEPAPEALDLGQLAREVAARCPKPVAVEAAAPVLAWADREHVASIVEEFLANARAFDPDGRLELSVRREHGHAVLEVADRGPGPGLDPGHAFEPYATSRPDGTGLGLAVVRALARANRGDVALTARPGGGSVASLRLPLAEG